MILLNPELQSKYEQDRNALRLFAQKEATDRLNIEIGDTKESVIFQPQIKLLRYDNEYNLSIRQIYEGREIPKIQSDGNKIIWQAGDQIARFYEIEKNETLPQGGFEFDSIVNLKKSGNKFYYTIQSKGISFLKQEEPTEQEKAEGVFMPEYIRGGYVLYANNAPINYEGGKLYRCGKIGEIPAPIITDKVGRVAKCALLISAERGLMQITVPDDFAAKAQNPCILDPTLGYTFAGASYTTCNNAESRGLLVTMGSTNATVQSLTLSCAINGGTPKFKGVISDNGAMAIVTDGIGPAATPAAAQAWKTSTFGTDPQMFAGGQYVINALQGPTSSDGIRFYHDTAGSNIGRWMTFDSYTTPTTISERQKNTNLISIYVTYTAVPVSGFLGLLI